MFPPSKLSFASAPDLIHICGGTLGLVSGTAAISFRKGSHLHVLAGKVFVVSMLVMAVGAICLGIAKHQPNNVGGAIFTFYLIGTAWLTLGEGTGKRAGWIGLLCFFLWVSGFSRGSPGLTWCVAGQARRTEFPLE